MLFIAEIGLNHNGNFDLAYELIRQAKASGADIVKFQLGWRDKPGELNHITYEVIRNLKKWSAFFDIQLLFSILTPEAYEMAKKYNFDTYKIASRTVKENPDLIKKMAKDGHNLIISLGMWERKTPPVPKNEKVKYLWCKSLYPAYPWDLVDLPKDFKKSIYDGYSDHSIGIEIPLIAIARGAEIIEKHFTLDKSDRSIRDHVLSATPHEFETMVNIGRTINRSLKLGV